jgi:ssDNA thymidine ADP-ribosyltransferase, DarT
MTTPRRGLLFHMTSIDNLQSIIDDGLLSDEWVRAGGQLQTEIGEDRIKAQRRTRPVNIDPGGHVSDYVPFYFAARSPMLYAIKGGRVPAYQAGQEPIVYLVTDAPSLQRDGCRFVFTDRNAVFAIAKYESDLTRLATLIDWPVMEGAWFTNTDEHPDRRERRMAEFLVRDRVPFSAITLIGTRSETMASRVLQIVGTMDPRPQVSVTPEWYF